MSKFLTISQAAEAMGISSQTLRRWERDGKIPCAQRTLGKQRRYDVSQIPSTKIISTKSEKITLAYARVSSHDQKEDLQRQEQMLSMYCAAQGWPFEILSDLGSGMNYHKRGLKALIHKILSEEICRLVLTHKDRLLRFGAELIFAIAQEKGIEVVIINKGKEPSFEEELASDVLEIITVFSARLYGSRSRKNKKLLNDLQQVVSNVGC